MTLDAARTLDPVRVVLVDDSDDVRGLVKMRLEREPDFVVVGEAGDGERGVQVVAAQLPHLVLLDVSMPVMDGLQALVQIRRESPGSIVVMLSGYGEDTGVASSCRSLGANGYIQKGGPPSLMIEELRRLLREEFPLPE